MNRALEVAVKSLKKRRTLERSRSLHRTAVTATGAAGGAFGLAGLVIELPSIDNADAAIHSRHRTQ